MEMLKAFGQVNQTYMNLLKKVRAILQEIRRVKQDNEQNRFLLGTLLAKNIVTAKSFKEAEFKVFSQFGDDGIIQFLLRNLIIDVDKFIEFGVENYEESNTRFLLMHDNWRGLIIDGSEDNIRYVKNDPLYWKYDLTAIHSFITVENINQILLDNTFVGNIGILSIDIDGNDYWVWQAIEVVDPVVVIIEYNSTFGSQRAITVPYEPNFDRSSAHYSGLYFGASLKSLCDLGSQKGYSLVGCNSSGNNAYFVKSGIIGDLKALSPEEGYIKARFREARDKNGKLTFINENDRVNLIKGLPVINTRNGQKELI